MPEYFWIILASVVSLSVGFMAGQWLGRKETLRIIENFRDRLGKVIHKLGLLEDEVSKIGGKAHEKNKFYDSTGYSAAKFAKDVATVGDRIDQVISDLKKKPWEGLKKAKDEPKIIIDNKSRNESIVSYNIVSPTDQSLSAFADERESNDFEYQYNYEAPHEQIIQLYNRGVDDRVARDKFRDEYLITRLGNNKAVEQRLGKAASPEFRKLDNGNFLAIPSAGGSFYVLPWFDTTLNSSAYNEGGFGYVFDCPNYNPEMAYTVVRVKRPAVFQYDGDNWTRTEKGELILQQ